MIGKRIAVIIALIIITVLTVLLFFFDIIGAPLLWRINYNKYYMDDFYNGGTLLEVNSDNYDDMAFKYSKYCKNLNSVIIRNPVNDFSYFDYINSEKLQYISIYGDLNDWSFLEKCSNLEVLYLEKSNFRDFSLLDKSNNLRTLFLSTNQKICYDGIENLASLEFASLALTDYDMTEICKLKSLHSLYFSGGKITDYSLINEMNLKDIGFSDYENADECVINLQNVELVSDVFFADCSFSMSEDELRNFFNKNINVNFDNCVFGDSQE